MSTKISKSLENEIIKLNQMGFGNDPQSEYKITVKIILDPRYKSRETNPSFEEKSVSSQQTSDGSLVQIIKEEFKKFKESYFLVHKSEHNPDDYILADLNPTQIYSLAQRDYVLSIKDDTPIMIRPYFRRNKNNINNSSNGKEKQDEQETSENPERKNKKKYVSENRENVKIQDNPNNTSNPRRLEGYHIKKLDEE